MKRIFIYSLMSIFILLVSCTDLDLIPTDSATPEVFFQDETAYRAFIAKVYAGLAVTGQDGPAGEADISSLDEGFSNYLRQYWQFQEVTTDEAVIGWGDEGLPDLHNHTWTSANQFVRAIYYRIFFQVSMANEFLRESTDEKLSNRGVSTTVQSDIKEYRAEARFLRALSLWHGIDLFGSIPFYTEESSIGSDAPTQADRSTVFNFIESELNAIEADMVAPGAQEYGRADRAAIWALQAKLFLNATVYTDTDRNTDCVTACKKIIDSGIYSLQDDYEHLFLADNHNSNEIIFAIPFDGQSTQTWGGMTYLTHAPIGGAMDDNIDDVTGEEIETKDEAAVNYGVNGGWGGLRTTSALVDLFPSSTGDIDERAIFYTHQQVKEITEISDFNQGYAVSKYKNLSSTGEQGSDLTHIDIDFPLFRLADFYLMYAEAVKRGGAGGDEATAVEYINQLRERAYDGANGNIAASDMSLEFILDERARELYWEGHRRTDLIRYNLFTENGTWPWKGGVAEGIPTESFRNLLPIPFAELLANTKLSQNSGY
ncbi:MAG: RagB/SusD family nutrient uptake outer membrane protein [Chitinophagales bacterium]